MSNGQGPLITSLAYRLALGGTGILTIFGASHGVRYALCGVMLLMLIVETIGSRRRKAKSGSSRGR